MKRWQILLLATMAVLAVVLFCIVASFSRALFEEPDPTAMAQIVAATNAANRIEASPTRTPIPTNTSIPMPTFTPIPTDTPIPTPTATRVVIDTVTPTITPIPTATPAPSNTPVPPVIVGGGGSVGGGSGAVNPSATPATRYPFGYVAEPLVYDTSNHFLVLLAKVTQGGIPVPGYKIVGTQSPTGFQWESIESCPFLCKASGPEAIYDEEGKEIETFDIQEGNLVFESPAYDTGLWTLMLVDPQGQQASEIFQLQLDTEDKKWFYYTFAR